MGEWYRRARESRLPWLLFYSGLTIELLMVIVDKSNYVNPIEGQLFRVTFLLFFLKLCLTDYSLREWAVIAVLEAVAFVSYRTTGGNDLIRLVTFAAACRNMPLKPMLKYTFYVTLAGCALIILLSVTGIYGEISLTQNYGHAAPEETAYIGEEAPEETRFTLGMGHPNALSCMFLMLVVLGVYIWFAHMKWYTYLFLMLLNVGVYFLTKSRTGMMIVTVFLAGGCLLHYCRILRDKAFIYAGGLLVLIVSLAFSVDAAACAQRVRDARWNAFFYCNPRDNEHIVLLERIDRMMSGRIISLTDAESNEGTIETWSLFSEPNHMNYYFDMGWVKLFYRYGIVPGALYIAALSVFLWKLYRRRDACGLLVYVILTIYTVIEAHLISVYLGRNFLLMMMACCLTEKDSSTR